MTQQLVITHASDMLQPEDAIAVFNDVQAGFLYNTPDITLKTPIFKKFIQELTEKICPLQYYNYSKSKNNIFEKRLGEKVRICTSGNSLETYSNIVCNSEDVARDVWEIYLNYSEDDDQVNIFMHSYFMNNGIMDGNTETLARKELTSISSKYYPYIDTNIMFDQFFTGAENIMLLVGKPGLGKSKMATLALKHAAENPDILPYDKIEENPGLDIQFINVVYVKSNEVLVNDKFWREMSKQQIDFCIIDDLDYMLTKRDSEVQSSDDLHKNAFLNQFLSFTDGVSKNKTKFIITTNQDYDDIDTALLRKGRLFDILELRHLDKPEALEIWLENDLDENDFHSIFTTHEVLPAELGSEISKRMNKRIDTATESYLKESNISKVKVAGRKKKISL